LFNDHDVENDPLVAILVAPPTRGVITFRTDGSFIYEPERGFIGTDTFVYMASDGATMGTPTTVIVNVDVNSAPPPPPPPGAGGNDNSTDPDEGDTVDPDSDTADNETQNSNSDLAGLSPSIGSGSTSVGGVSGFDLGQGNGENPRGQIAAEPDQSIELISYEQGLSGEQALEEQIMLNAIKLRDLIAAYSADSDSEETAKAEIKIGGKTIEVNFNRRQLWEQLAYLQEQLKKSENERSDATIEDFGFDLSAATMAASLSYIIWFLRGSAMMATMVTQVPSWKMIDPLVILDSMSGESGDSSEDQDIINSYFENNEKKSR
jgi:hypothetical protein